MSAALHLRGVLLPGGETGDLWLQDGLISHQPIPGATTVFDGGYVLPGLVDAHCHVGIGPEGPVELDVAVQQAETDRDAGTLLIRDCGAPIDTRPLQERTDLPRIIRAGRHLAKPKRYIPYLADQLEDESELPRAVAEQAEYGDGWVKLVGDWIDRSAGDLAPLWSDGALTEAIEVAHAHGARVTAHVFGEEALPGLLRAGIDCIEHGTGLTDDTVELMARHGTALVPTLVNIENFPSFAASASKYPDYAAHMTALYERGDATVAKAVEAGVPVYAGTDAGGGIEHGVLVDEVLALHRVGLSAEEALGTASWSAREWLGYGGLQHGAVADLLCYDDDPRKDLAALRHPRRIVLRGAVVG
ncbi:MAG: amidohydrolase family protein [Saccharopolyspora sp.]|uniref:metal-dependent hydrolase family protein n=1 Tax=Saccharopolyspora TaxID=1835 RepID=UPI00190D87BE|nr:MULTISPECIES: amidohydrolase family protein [unclassified Saccharopolyspora]MBK0867484.1 amidohydrolase family protein [Saccharopolyspora sp. HNM0986]MBQ6643965.1 amidohydrolase family protein [Saccharopolyspora sp.]